MWWLIVGVALGVVALAHTAPFPFLLEWIGPGRSVWHLPRSDGAPTIYLTYDDGPNPDATPALLDVLARERVSATFFIIPKHVTAETAHIISRAVDEGHTVALHSHTRSLLLKRPAQLAQLLDSQAAEIERITGRRPCALFRPHAGWRGGEMYRGLDRAGFTLAGWSFGMWDWNWWRVSRPEKTAARLASRASDGAIVVMHDGHHKNPRANRRHTVGATAELIVALRTRGFQFGNLCAAIDGYSRRETRNERMPAAR